MELKQDRGGSMGVRKRTYPRRPNWKNQKGCF